LGERSLVVHNGEEITLDEEKLAYEANAEVSRLLERS
jgi:hypothetical protein